MIGAVNPIPSRHRNDVWIDTTPSCFIRIALGDGAVIGAGSCCTSIPPYAIVREIPHGCSISFLAQGYRRAPRVALVDKSIDELRPEDASIRGPVEAARQ